MIVYINCVTGTLKCLQPCKHVSLIIL